MEKGNGFIGGILSLVLLLVLMSMLILALFGKGGTYRLLDGVKW